MRQYRKRNRRYPVTAAMNSQFEDRAGNHHWTLIDFNDPRYPYDLLEECIGYEFRNDFQSEFESWSYDNVINEERIRDIEYDYAHSIISDRDFDRVNSYYSRISKAIDEIQRRLDDMEYDIGVGILKDNLSTIKDTIESLEGFVDRLFDTLENAGS